MLQNAICDPITKEMVMIFGTAGSSFHRENIKKDKMHPVSVRGTIGGGKNIVATMIKAVIFGGRKPKHIGIPEYSNCLELNSICMFNVNTQAMTKNQHYTRFL